MQKYIGISIIVAFIAVVIFRNFTLKKQGIEALEFGRKDKKDFIILSFAVFYLYLIAANVFVLPTIPGQIIFRQEIVSWIGVFLCFSAFVIFVWAMISFKKSFRVGLVDNSSQGLISNGAFAISRNPIYVSFAIMLVGQFLIFHSWILLIYIPLGITRFHMQVLKEELFLNKQYGNEFNNYAEKVRRYL